MLKPRKRLTKKQLKEDKLLLTVAKIQAYMEHEWKRISIIFGSAIVIIIFGVYLFNQNKQHEQEAASKLYELEFQYIEQQIYNEQLVQQLQSFIDQYSSTQSGGFATFYLANAYYNIGNYQNAEQYYRRYLDQYGETDFLKSSALAGIASCYEQQTMFNEASEFYLRSVREFPDEFITPDNMLGAARTLVLAGQVDEAMAQCQNIIDRYPNTNTARKAEILLARL